MTTHTDKQSLPVYSALCSKWQAPSFFLPLKEKAQTEVLFSAVLLSVVNAIIVAALHTIFKISSIFFFNFFLQAYMTTDPPTTVPQSAGDSDAILGVGVSVFSLFLYPFPTK